MNFDNKGALGTQGLPTPSIGTPLFKQRFPAGNEFVPDYFDDRQKLHSTATYTYYRHLGPDKVIPNDIGSSAIINISLDGDAVDKGSDNYLACRPIFIVTPVILPLSMSSTEFLRLDSLENSRDSLEEVLIGVKDNIDNGQTDYLLYLLNRNTPKVQLTLALFANSPLSDTVLISAITHNRPFGPVMFTLFMEENLPVTNKVLPYFIEYVENMPPVFKNYLLSLNADNPLANNPGKLEKEIEAIEINRQLYLNDLIMKLVDSLNNRKDDALTLLENENTIEADQILAGTYIADKDLASAQAKINEIEANSDEQDWVSLNRLLMGLYEDGKTIYDLDSAGLSRIREFAYSCPASLATSSAQSILYFLYREEVPDCPLDDETKSFHVQSPDGQDSELFYEDEENEVLGENYPDPASDFTEIPYFLPEGRNATMTITSIEGREMFASDLQPGENILNIETKNWPAGVYLYSMKIERLPLITKKLVIGR